MNHGPNDPHRLKQTCAKFSFYMPMEKHNTPQLLTAPADPSLKWTCGKLQFVYATNIRITHHNFLLPRPVSRVLHNWWEVEVLFATRRKHNQLFVMLSPVPLKTVSWVESRVVARQFSNKLWEVEFFMPPARMTHHHLLLESIGPSEVVFCNSFFGGITKTSNSRNLFDNLGSNRFSKLKFVCHHGWHKNLNFPHCF